LSEFDYGNGFAKWVKVFPVFTKDGIIFQGSSGDNINKGNTSVHLTDPLPQSNSDNNYWPTYFDWIWLILFFLLHIISKSNYDLS
jgi:hypothetical protein